MNGDMGRRGSSLLIVLLITAILGGLLVSVGASTMFHLRSSSKGEEETKQDLAARAGLHHALAVLKTDEARTATLTGTLKNGFRYEVSFVNNQDSSLGTNYKADDGTPVAPGHVYIRSMGYSTDVKSKPYGYAAQAWRPPITVTTAAFGDETVAIKDTEITHWSRDRAPAEFIPPGNVMSSSNYAAAMAGMQGDRRPPTMKATAKFTKALLGTNSNSMESLWAEGDSVLGGNIAYGEGAPITAKSGVVSVIGAAASTAQQDSGLSPFSPSQGADDETQRIASSVNFKGKIEVFPNKIPFPSRPPISGYGYDEVFTGPQAQFQPITSAPMSSTMAAGAISAPVPVMAVAEDMTPIDPTSFALDQADSEEILTPGRYGKVELQPGSIVRLTPGVYEIDEIIMNDATIVVDQDGEQPTILTVKDRFEANDSDINRYRHDADAYDADRYWLDYHLDKQSGNPSKLEIYFQGEAVGDDGVTIDSSAFVLNGTHISGATVGKEADTKITGGAVHGAFKTDSLDFDSTKVYHPKSFQNPRKSLSTDGPWTLKNANRLGKTGLAGELGDDDPWKKIEEQWNNPETPVAPEPAPVPVIE
jgi:hypothetical protein